eukprot:6208167-Pleurochrysis_carterae.AAC.1
MSHPYHNCSSTADARCEWVAVYWTTTKQRIWVLKKHVLDHVSMLSQSAHHSSSPTFGSSARCFNYTTTKWANSQNRNFGMRLEFSCGAQTPQSQSQHRAAHG